MSVHRSLSVAGLTLALLAWSWTAMAAKRKILLLNPDKGFERSVEIALSPWNLDVVAYEAPPPRATEAEQGAKQIASAAESDAVIWVSGPPDVALWVYDAGSNRVDVRALSTPPPFDNPTAASVALSLKILLGESLSAPEAAEPPRPAAAPAKARTWVGEAGAGVRVLGGTAEPRGTVGGSYWPPVLEQRLGAALDASFGPGFGVTRASFNGRFQDLAVSPSARVRLPLGARFTVQPLAGVGVHATSIDGMAATTPVHASRIDWSLDAGALLGYAPAAWLEVGVRGGLSYLARYQGYLVDGSPVLELSPFMADVGLFVGIGAP